MKRRSVPGRLFRGHSIRAVLIALLLPGIILLLVIDSWNDYQTLADVSMDAYDSALVEPARVLENSIELEEDGSLRLAAPLYVQAMLESREGLRKYFSIEYFESGQGKAMANGDPGTLLAGLPDLPRPPLLQSFSGRPQFYDATYRNERIRVAAIGRDVYRAGQHRRILILMGESVGLREEVEATARRHEIGRDIRMLGLVTILVWLGVAWAMSPLHRLRDDIRARSPDDLTPLDASDVPVEVVPLVDAVNHHIQRHRRVLDEQTQFLDDASHQLRTPLAIMLTQAQYALREKDNDRTREGLTALVAQLRQTRRLTDQLLSLAHASQSDGLQKERHDVRALAQQVVMQYFPLAREKQQDLGFEDDGNGRPVWAVINELEVHEVLSNLLHNAIHYSPKGATITVGVTHTATHVSLSVRDNGVGLDASLRERVFARFDRVLDKSNNDKSGGSGLGLAIARAYARRNGGDVELRDGEPNAQGSFGLTAVLILPLNPGT